MSQIRRDETPNEKLVRKYFQDVVHVVYYFHSRGFCHRDLKPQNVLEDEDGKVKITGFGEYFVRFSHLQHPHHRHEWIQWMPLTKDNMPYHRAPEVIHGWKGGNYDHEKVDSWSCGVILYLLLTGRR